MSTPKPASKLSDKEARDILAGKAPVEKVPWTADMALRLVGVTDAPRVTQVRKLKAALREGRIPEAAAKALRAAGYAV